MIKQWKNENLGVTYFYLPNSKNNEILTSDGVLIPYDEFKSMTSEMYNAKKNTNGGYDYMLSKQSERLVKKALNVKKESVPTSSSTQTTKPTVVSTPTPIKRVKNPIQLTEKAKGFIESEKKKDVETVAEPKKVEVEEKKEVNLFDVTYPIIMLFITIVCSLLSINFTGIYLTRLQPKVIAYAISTVMLLFGLIGFQMGRRSKKNGHIGRAIVYFVTSIMVVSFSMISSLDVNYSRYKANHKEIEIVENTDDGVRLNYDLIEKQIADNKEEIERLRNDTEFQKTQYVLAWDNELGKSVLLEGQITKTAQTKITENNEHIDELLKENKSLNEKLMEYAESGISIEEENVTDKAKTLTDLLGSILKISGNVIQLIFLLVPSFFIDIIGILALGAYVDKFEEKKKEEK
jgi:hypothetical protein